MPALYRQVQKDAPMYDIACKAADPVAAPSAEARLGGHDGLNAYKSGVRVRQAPAGGDRASVAPVAPPGAPDPSIRCIGRRAPDACSAEHSPKVT